MQDYLGETYKKYLKVNYLLALLNELAENNPRIIYIGFLFTRKLTVLDCQGSQAAFINTNTQFSILHIARQLLNRLAFSLQNSSKDWTGLLTAAGSATIYNKKQRRIRKAKRLCSHHIYLSAQTLCPSFQVTAGTDRIGCQLWHSFKPLYRGQTTSNQDKKEIPSVWVNENSLSLK